MADTSGQRLDDIWVPRIGARATSELRRSGYTALIAGPTILILAIASSFAFGSGSASGEGLGFMFATLALVCFVALIRSRLRLATAISQWFGVKIGWLEIPRMRRSQFDDWRARKNLQHRP